MLRYQNKPPRRRADKPVTKAIAQQRRSAEIDRKFVAGLKIYFACLGMFVLAEAAASGLRAPPQVARPGDMLHVAAEAVPPGAHPNAVPANMLTSPWGRAGHGCMLNEAVMLKPGGVLTVLATRGSDVVLTWAGGATAAGAAACPGAGQLLVSAANYEKLAAVEQGPHPVNPR